MGCLQSSQAADGAELAGSGKGGGTGNPILDATTAVVHAEVPTASGSTPAAGDGHGGGDVSTTQILSKLRTDCRVKDLYSMGKVLGMGGESHVRGERCVPGQHLLLTCLYMRRLLLRQAGGRKVDRKRVCVQDHELSGRAPCQVGRFLAVQLRAGASGWMHGTHESEWHPQFAACTQPQTRLISGTSPVVRAQSACMVRKRMAGCAHHAHPHYSQCGCRS